MTTTKLKTIKIGKPIEITWLDHCGWADTRWHNIEDSAALKPVTVKTVGYVIKETKKYIVVASVISEAEHTNGEMCIIKGCITKRKKL